MGHLYKKVGKFTIEGRRESFYIHADYGLKPLLTDIQDIGPGQFFKFNLKDHTVYVVDSINRTMIRYEDAGNSEAFGTVRLDESDPVYLTDAQGRFIGSEVRDDNDPLGRLWNDFPHPEVAIEDLHDLITALTNYQNTL
jgi:hypothetical protein